MPRISPSSASPDQPGELALIARIRQRLGNKSFPGLALGIGDDCALLEQKPGEQIVVTTDLSIDGRHFRLEWHPPEAVGCRTLARGLSDLAAMGARPLAAFLSLGLLPELTRPKARKAGQGNSSWMDRFLDGFFALARAHKMPLAGGDLAQSKAAVADIVLIGAVPRGRALLRSGAQVGDRLYVTGSLGGSSAGLKTLEKLARTRRSGVPNLSAKMQNELAAHLAPQPRLAQGLWLQQHGIATAAIDLSDGLSTDLAHLCEDSKVGAEVSAADLPIAQSATLDQALHGGEDYELLFAAPPSARVPRAIAGVKITPIGRLVSRRRGQPSVLLRRGPNVEPLAPQGWQHFR